ncbi:MAG TPA: DUF1801 domain-containing protein [Phenylobacterium sp.]|nr:DUF1801 domain-containing protein [Phenylobacterium sp.]
MRAVFEAQPPALRDALLDLRGHILAAAAAAPAIGRLTETLKWGEPAYLPAKPRVGTTVRINAVKGSARRYAAYFHCQTTLLESFRLLYPEVFEFEGNRAILFRVGEAVPDEALRHCLTMALTYHLKPRGSAT